MLVIKNTASKKIHLHTAETILNLFQLACDSTIIEKAAYPTTDSLIFFCNKKSSLSEILQVVGFIFFCIYAGIYKLQGVQIPNFISYYA